MQASKYSGSGNWAIHDTATAECEMIMIPRNTPTLRLLLNSAKTDKSLNVENPALYNFLSSPLVAKTISIIQSESCKMNIMYRYHIRHRKSDALPDAKYGEAIR